MRNAFNWIFEMIAAIHDQILHWNDSIENSFTDKQLHLIVFGAGGFALFLLVHWLFSYLAKRGHTIAISWIYSMTLMIGVTLAIEIGQALTGTGNMELFDMLYGLWGFLLIFIAFVLVRAVVRRLTRRVKEMNKNAR